MLRFSRFAPLFGRRPSAATRLDKAWRRTAPSVASSPANVPRHRAPTAGALSALAALRFRLDRAVFRIVQPGEQLPLRLSLAGRTTASAIVPVPTIDDLDLLDGMTLPCRR
jgi:hypothetical protein